MKQNKVKIRRNLKALRKLIDATDEPVLVAVAYGMEIAISWATEDTVGWQKPAREAQILADICHARLRKESAALVRFMEAS